MEAMERCEREGFTERNLEGVLHCVRGVGGERIAWRAEWRVDRRGGLWGRWGSELKGGRNGRGGIRCLYVMRAEMWGMIVRR